MFAPPLFGLCSHSGLVAFFRPLAGLRRPESSDRFRAGSGPISARVATDLGGRRGAEENPDLGLPPEDDL